MEKIIEERTWQAKTANEVVQHIVSARTYSEFVANVLCQKTNFNSLTCIEAKQYLYYILLQNKNTTKVFNKNDSTFKSYLYKIMRTMASEESTFRREEKGLGKHQKYVFTNNVFIFDKFTVDNNIEIDESKFDILIKDINCFLNKYEKQNIENRFQVYIFKQNIIEGKKLTEIAREVDLDARIIFSLNKKMLNALQKEFKQRKIIFN